MRVCVYICVFTELFSCTYCILSLYFGASKLEVLLLSVLVTYGRICDILSLQK